MSKDNHILHDKLYYWALVSYVARGTQHIYHNIPCQDDIQTYHQNNISIAILADGVGSLSHAEIGAKNCTIFALEFFKKNAKAILDKPSDFRLELLNYIKEMQSEYAIKHNFLVKDMQSTLLFFMHDTTHFVYGHIGDGAIVVYDIENKIHTSTQEKINNFNGTHTWLSDYQHMRLSFGHVNELYGYAMMSDGVQDALMIKKTNQVVPALKTKFIDFLIDNKELYVQSVFKEVIEGPFRSQSHDDMSLIVSAKTKIGSDYIIDTFIQLYMHYHSVNKSFLELKYELNSILSLLTMPIQLSYIVSHSKLKKQNIYKWLVFLLKYNIIEINKDKIILSFKKWELQNE